MLVGSWFEVTIERQNGTENYEETLDLKVRNRRQVETEQLIYLPKKAPEENLMLGLIKEFSNLQNVTQITACLPIPRAVGESVPWGILTMNLTNLRYKNETTH